VSTLLVDNYDSYTYNVFQLLADVTGEEPIVVHNDTVSWRALSRWPFDAIVLSPGPGRPERWHDFGVCGDVLRFAEAPVLGICLGHQGLAQALQASVAAAPEPMHGRLSRIKHSGAGLFAGIPQELSVVRYHSLAVTGTLWPQGRVIAWTEDGVVMGIEHLRRPMWGVQFHPESIATEHGRRLVENFYTSGLARSAKRRHPRTAPSSASGSAATRQVPKPAPSERARSTAARPATARAAVPARIVELAGAAPSELVFERLFAEREHAFWLDSADASSPLSRCSYLGTSAGSGREVLSYEADRRVVKALAANATKLERCTIFEALERRLGAAPLTERDAGAPRGLVGGYFGYLGYECKSDCGSANRHRSDLPDAVLMLANRMVAIDHVREHTFVMALCDEDVRDVERWLAHACEAIGGLLAGEPEARDASPLPSGTGASPVAFACGRGRSQYLSDIARCHAALGAGESYEICLTDQIDTAASPDPWTLYRLLRRRNPAPFAAYLKLASTTVLSSSPERFLSVDRDRHVQARPIKGTNPRSPDGARDEILRSELLHDEKTFAEHLMIVDLLRNDLGRVCEVGSVRVPDLMVVESYATVHQLISNVTGTLGREQSAVQCVRACFPGGSMTGAPKLRTMEIIDSIEREARGVYSGAIGYFGRDGSVDLSIVIRTIVMRQGRMTIGAGGAIVTQSDPAEEFEELLLKARAPMAAIAEAVNGRRDAGAWTIELEPASASRSARSS
jgi:para-aminobenzoate synthetase